MNEVRNLVLALAVCGAPAIAQVRPFTVPQLQARVVDEDLTAAARCAALIQLQSRGELSAATVVLALRSPAAAVADSAAAIVRHGWSSLPTELFDALVEEPLVARPLGRELALAPRPSFAGLAEQLLRDERITGDARCLWLAARGRPLTLKEANLLLAVLVSGEAGDGCHAAFAVLPELVADALVAKLHGLLLQGKVEVAAATPWFDRLSADGRARLLSLAVTLPPAPASEICQYVIDHAPGVYDERAVAALDGAVPLERLWLQRAAPLLDRPERIERVLVVLADQKASADLRRAAFETLANARVVDERVLAYAEESTDSALRPLHRLLDVAVERIPAERLLQWLQSTPEFSTPTLAALGRRPQLEPMLERALLAPIAEAGGVLGLWCERAAVVLAARAAPQAVADAWPLLRTAPNFDALVEALSKRREPKVRELLSAELRAPALPDVDAAAREVQLAAVRLALVNLGERAHLAALVAQGPHLPPPFVRRCTALGEPLDVAMARSLIAAARQADVRLATELLSWAARCIAPELTPLWLDVRATAESFEAQEISLRALCAGGHRPAFVAELRAAIRSGKWNDDLDALRYEVVATAMAPHAADDLELLAELVLLAPLAEPAAERERVERWPDGSHGFPFVAAIAQALRGADPAAVQMAFTKVVNAWREHDERDALSRQGLLVLWRSLEMDRDVQTAVGVATCTCFDELLGGDPEVGAGPAAWYAMLREQAAGRPAQAAAAARAAVEHLLFDAHRRRDARLFLGERDPGGREDPWAALAASPAWFEALRAADLQVWRPGLRLSAYRGTAVEQHLGLCLDRVGHDARYRAMLEQ